MLPVMYFKTGGKSAAIGISRYSHSDRVATNHAEIPIRSSVYLDHAST